jgi:hypothetical protein
MSIRFSCDDLPDFQQVDDFLDAPNVILDGCFYGGRRALRTADVVMTSV